MKLFLSLSLLLTITFFKAQEHISGFGAVTLTYKFHPKFFLYVEGQMRSIEDFTYPDYYEMKGGLGYYLTKNHKPFIGLGRYATYKEHAINKEEFRVWLQDVIDIKKGIVKFENRIRVEKSWFYEPQTDKNSQRLRYRYRLNVSVPLNSKEVKKGTIFANAYDEIFLISPMKPTFARNRVYAGGGYQIDNNVGVAAGYLWQREFNATGNQNFHFLYLALNINIDGTNHPVKTFDYPGAD
jgi:predicted porin